MDRTKPATGQDGELSECDWFFSTGAFRLGQLWADHTCDYWSDFTQLSGQNQVSFDCSKKNTCGKR
jgi:hypothetical protein